jgi:uncharacterized protein (DUF58 family)
MKSKVLSVCAALLLLVVVGAVPAKAQTSIALEANIPFDFIIGGKTLPAGEYTINTARNQPAVLIFRNVQAKASAQALTDPVETKTGKGAKKLVFHRYGSQYFLSSVWGADDGVGRGLSKSKLERELIAGVQGPAVEVVAANTR